MYINIFVLICVSPEGEFVWIRVSGPIAQSVEHRADNAGVSGSIPDGPTKKNGGHLASRLLIVVSAGGGPAFGSDPTWVHEFR